MRLPWIPAALLTTALGASAQNAPPVPAELTPPGGGRMMLQGHALGVQIYECKAVATDAAAFAWTFIRPQANLVDASGQLLATHSAGPTWQTFDGSQVKGKVIAQVTPDPASIPWLLLEAIAYQGEGAMRKVLYIQRLHTTGGKAPVAGCDAAHAGAKTNVDYTADYVFYGLAAAEPVRLIFDTDVGNDVDDALALAMIHALESRGEAKLLAVTITKDNRYAAPYIDLVDTFYGRSAIPIGVVRDGKTPEDSAMLRQPAERRNPDGSLVYPHKLLDGRDAPDAVTVLRRVLAAEADGAVTIIQVGFSTNLAALLGSAPDAISPLTGAELAAKKVRLLSTMAGAFPSGNPEFNVKTDIPSARRVFAEWPSPVVFSGFEIGLAMLYPATSIERDFSWVANHPVAEAYRAYKAMPYDRPTWDLTAVLYAVRPERGYFALSAPGRVGVADDGRTVFTADEAGTRRYLVLADSQKARVLDAMISLASQPLSAASPAGTAK